MAGFLDGEEKALKKLFAGLPKRMGVTYLNHFLDSFKNEGFTDSTLEKWKPRSRADKNKKKRGLLVNRGRLLRSIKLDVKGTRIVIHTSVPYAEIHNEGGQVAATVKVRKYSRKTKTGKADVKAHSRNVNFKMPKRQFMGESKKVANDLEKKLEKEFLKIFK